MQVKQEQINPCLIELEIEIDAQTVRKAVDQTYKEAGKTVNIPGFRKGKAPRAILEKFVDPEKIKDIAADKIIEAAYKDALEETKIEPFAPANVEVVKFDLDKPEEAFVAKASVPLEPKVELGEYKGIEIERKSDAVTEDKVQAEIDKMLDRNADMNQIYERNIQTGDIVLVEMGRNDQPEEEPKRNVVKIGENLPDLDKGMVDMGIDEEKVIDVTYPDDHEVEDLRGKTIPFTVKALEIHERIVPELTDEWVSAKFVKPLEEGAEPDPDAIDTADKVRAEVRKAMEKAADDVADSEVYRSLLDKIIETSTVNFPDVLVEQSVRERFQHLSDELKERKLTVEDYIKYKGITFDELYAQFKEEETKGLTNTLIVHEIIKAENITIEDTDIDAYIKSMAEERKVPEETILAYIEKTNSMQSIRNDILQKKVVDFLTQVSNIKNVGQK